MNFFCCCSNEAEEKKVPAADKMSGSFPFTAMSTTSFPVEIVAQKLSDNVHNAVFARDKIFTVGIGNGGNAITVLSLIEKETSNNSSENNNNIKMQYELKEERSIETSSSGYYKTPLAANNFNIFTCDKENHVVAFSLEDDYKLVYKSSKKHETEVQCLDCHPINCDEVATASMDRNCIIWNIRDDTQRLVLKHESGLFCVRYSTKGDRIAVGTDHNEGSIIYDTETGTLLVQIKTSEYVYGFSWSQNDEWLCACYHASEAVLIETKNYTTVKKFAVNSCANSSEFYGSDRFCIIGTWGCSIHVIDMKTLEFVSEEGILSKKDLNSSAAILEVCVAPRNSYIRPTLTNVDRKFQNMLLVAQQRNNISVLKLPTFGFVSRRRVFMMKEFSNREKTRISLCLDIYNVLYTTSKFLDIFETVEN